MHPNSVDASQAQASARKRRILPRAIGIGVLILLPLFGLAAALLSFLCVANTCFGSAGGTLISTAPLGKVLTISQVASHIAPVTVPLVMGIFAYWLGAQWLIASKEEGRNRPSPLQFAHLLTLCNGANFPSLFRALQSLLRLTPETKRQTLPVPPLLRYSVALLTLLLALAYTISGADAWFHASSQSIIVRSVTPFSSSPSSSSVNVNFGRQINMTMCDDPRFIPDGVGQRTCGMVSMGSAGDGPMRAEGLRTLSSSSSRNKAVFAEDETYILVPPTLPGNVTYTAKSLGVQARCISITQECIAPHPSTDGPFYGPAAGLLLDCPGPHVYNVTSIPNPGALDGRGERIYGYDVPSNPFNVGAIVTSQAYEGPQDQFLPGTGFFIHGKQGGFNVVFCNVTVLDVTYLYESPNTHTLLSTSPASLQHTRYVATYAFEGPNYNVVADAVEGTGLTTNEPYERAYAREVARRTLASTAVLYMEREPESEVGVTKEVNGSKLKIAPLTLLLAASVLYGLVVLVLLLLTAIRTSGVLYVSLAASHLSDPFATVHALHSSETSDPADSWQESTLRRFEVEGEQDRLYVGVWGSEGEAFGVKKGYGGLGGFRAP